MAPSLAGCYLEKKKKKKKKSPLSLVRVGRNWVIYWFFAHENCWLVTENGSSFFFYFFLALCFPSFFTLSSDVQSSQTTSTIVVRSIIMIHYIKSGLSNNLCRFIANVFKSLLIGIVSFFYIYP